MSDKQKEQKAEIKGNNNVSISYKIINKKEK